MARILVVDDEPDIRELVATSLQRAQHKVVTAGSGVEALEVVTQRGMPDLAVLDIGMPQMSGLELLDRLRERPGAGRLPTVFLSAHVLPQDIKAGTDLGAAYLTKPFIATALLSTIERLLNPAPSTDGW